MKILIFNWRDISNPDAGGAELYIHQIGRRLARKHEVVFYAQAYEGGSRYDEIDGVRVVRRGGVFSMYLYAMFDYLFGVLRKEKFDVVVDGINGVPFFTPLFVRAARIAVIYHLVRKDIFFKELPFPLSLVGWTAERLIPFIYCRTAVVTISPSTRDELVEFGIAEDRLSIVYAAIEPPPQVEGKRAERPLVVYLGRIKAYKQLEHLLKAFPFVLTQMPQAELIIAGRGEYDTLETLTGELGIADSVKLVGEVSEERKAEILNGAWLFVTPSFKEGWGLSVIEANACGVPAIAYNVPGLRDSIRDGETGLLVPLGDIAGLGQAIVKVLGDAELRERLGHSARDWAFSFNWDKSAEDFASVIERLTNG